jgi:hypothetical protein
VNADPSHPSVPVIPDVVEPASLNDYLEVITRAVFQAGVKWRQIAGYWDAYRVAFDGFDPVRVAAFDDIDVQRILETPGILRTPRKVLATIANARAILALERDFGGFDGYLATFPTYAETAKDFKRRFKFLGDMNVWYVLFRTGHAVPRFETWIETIPGDHPRMREMVERARTQGKSPER